MARRPRAAEFPTPKIRLTGEAKTGKTTLITAIAEELMAKAGPQAQTYLWNTDGREEEYSWHLGADRVLMPEAHPLDVQAVSEEIEQDFMDGTLKPAVFMVLDNMTHIFTKGVRGGGVLALNKAKTMSYVRLVLAQFQCPFVATSHQYEAALASNLKQKQKRDTISTTEEDRMAHLFNIELECVEKDGVFGVVVKSCRYKPQMKPFTIWDKEGAMFKGFYTRIMKAIFGENGMTQEEAKAAEPHLLDFKGKAFPNPDKKATFAIDLGARYFEEVGDKRYYPFGDPEAKVEKKDGNEGTNGVLVHARNAYAKIKSGQGDYGKPTSAEQMAEYWIADCQRRVKEAIEADKKAKTNGGTSEPIPAVEGQSEMTF